MSNPDAYDHNTGDPSAGGMTKPADRTMLALLHLSQFCGYLIPFAGFIAPVVIWLVTKDESPEYDSHGRLVTNWAISQSIYMGISIVLCLVLVGIPLVVLFGTLGVIYPIVGAIKASKGEYWNYPLTIHFL